MAHAHHKSDAGSLLEHIDGLVDGLRQRVPDAIREGEIEAVHQARVATRRLKAALDLLSPVIHKDHLKPFARTLRKLRRRLGPVRDLDVMRGHLTELSGSSVHAKAIAWLLARVESARKSAGEQAQTDAPPTRVLSKLGAWWGLREEIAGACKQTEELLRESLRSQLEEFSRQADRLSAAMPPVRASESNESGEPPPSKYPPERVDPHAIRIAGKSLRYTLEMARADGHDLSGDVLKTFKRMQEALGLWHDYVVLTERMLAMSSAEQLAHHDAPAQRRILALAQITLRKAESFLAKFAALWREKGGPVAEAIHEIFKPGMSEPEHADTVHVAAESEGPH